ncbi:hypothetical protein ACQZV8_19725, partial [Magnetococcales bacterium HHB-1]
FDRQNQGLIKYVFYRFLALLEQDDTVKMSEVDALKQMLKRVTSHFLRSDSPLFFLADDFKSERGGKMTLQRKISDVDVIQTAWLWRQPGMVIQYKDMVSGPWMNPEVLTEVSTEASSHEKKFVASVCWRRICYPPIFDRQNFTNLLSRLTKMP